MKRIADTPAFRWYIGYDLDERLPDPSDLSKFRRRLGPGFFQTLLARVIELGEAAGLVKNEAFLMDSTRVAADKATRRACPFRSHGVAAQSPDTPRTITRFDPPYVQAAEQACRSGRGKALLRRRQTCIEGINADAKTHPGLDRARWRGVRNLSIQARLTAAVLNLKKLLQASPKTKSVGQGQVVPPLHGPVPAASNARFPSPMDPVLDVFAAGVRGRVLTVLETRRLERPGAIRGYLTPRQPFPQLQPQVPSSATAPCAGMTEGKKGMRGMAEKTKERKTGRAKNRSRCSRQAHRRSCDNAFGMRFCMGGGVMAGCTANWRP